MQPPFDPETVRISGQVSVIMVSVSLVGEAIQCSVLSSVARLCGSFHKRPLTVKSLSAQVGVIKVL